MPKTLCIVQARMGSSRLPGKVLKLINNQPVLGHIINRLKRVAKIEQIVVATSDLDIDTPIAEFCNTNAIACYRGSESDVLQRFYDAATKYQGDVIIRITGDCPLIDAEIIEAMLSEYDTQTDYFSNCHPRRTVPVGLDTEIFSYAALSRLINETKDTYDHEHVTPYFYKNPGIFTLRTFESLNFDLRYRLTLDTREDFELISKIYLHFKDREYFSYHDIISSGIITL